MQRSLLDQPDALRWEYPSIQGPKPSPRFVQTASLVGDSEIVFIGGKQNEESRLDEIHILVLSTTTATTRFSLPLPLAVQWLLIQPARFVFVSYAGHEHHALQGAHHPR